jgi:glycosyltransferase involved in cell wall biosynthesis
MTRWPIRMVVAGPGVEEDLAPLAEQLGIRERCEFTGLIPPERIADLMRRCAFLIIPSRYEPFGIVIIEAMACGKPVVATRSGGPEGLVTPENGLLVPPGDVEALTGAITTMLESFHRYNAEAIARKTLETYGDRVVTERLTSFYANLPMSRRRRNTFAEPIY